MPPEIANLLLQYDLAVGNAARDQIAVKIVEATERWYATGGQAAVEKGKAIADTLMRKGSNPALVQRLREGGPQITKALDTAQKMAPQASRQQLWQELMRQGRAVAGGAQNLARMIMNAGGNLLRGGANIGRDILAAGVAAASIGLSAIGRAIAAGVAAVGGWEVVLGALVVVAACALIAWIMHSYKSPKQHEIRDPLLKRLEGNTIRLKPMLGNA